MRTTPLLGLIPLAVLLGCEDHPTPVLPPPVVSVSMTSSRALTATSSGADSLVLHVVRTSVHTSSVGWSVISEAARDVDLRQLAGTVEEIATGTVASGLVNQIRFDLDGATLVNDAGTRDVTVPSATLKLIIAPPIEVVSGSTTAVSLTVDGTMEHEAGDKYILRPVVKLSPE